jgi:hypothetical protein
MKLKFLRLPVLVFLALFFCLLPVLGKTWDPNLTPVYLVDSISDEFILDNVRWGMKFNGKDFSTIYRRTKIDYDQVEKIYFCAEDFPPKFLASHIYLAFIFKNRNAVKTTDGKHKARGLVISVTNRLLKGESASSLMKAFFPKRSKQPWPLLFEVGTLADRLQKSLIVSGRDVKMYPLNLQPEMAKLVLKTGIELSLVDRSKDFYHLIFNNCAVNAFKILKEALGQEFFPDYWSVKGKLVNRSIALPKFNINYLNKRKLSDRNERVYIAHNARRVTIPSDYGNLTYKISSMPGFARATPAVLPFAIELQDYLELAKASKDLQRLVGLLGITHPDCFKYINLKMEVDTQTYDSSAALIEHAKKNPQKVNSYFIDAIKRNRLERKPGFKQLAKVYIDFLKFEINHERNLEAELQKTITYLEKKANL